MNIELAKHIPISEILCKLNVLPKKVSKKEYCYLSPLRIEKTPSFFVNIEHNLWYDHGLGIGGDLISFGRYYLESRNEDHTTSDALRWIKNIYQYQYTPDISFTPEFQAENNQEEDSSLILKSKKSINHLGLIHYLEKRGIPLNLAKQFLKELHVQNKRTNKSFYALGFPNEEGGFELRNPFFKGCLRPKAISFIRGTTPKPEGIHLFEGFMDYLSVVTQLNGKKIKGDTIILNSLSCLKQALPYIQNYGYRFYYTWFDNDNAGTRGSEVLADFLKAESSLKQVKMNKVYQAHKDVNAWHMKTLGL